MSTNSTTEVVLESTLAYVHSHNVLGVSYDTMEVWLSSDNETNDVGARSRRAHESQPEEPRKSTVQSITLDASQHLCSLSKAPCLDVGHPLDENLTCNHVPLPKLGFEKINMYMEANTWSSKALIVPNHTASTYINNEKEQAQQVSCCEMEIYASPSLKIACQKAGKELDVEKIHMNVPQLISTPHDLESHSIFKTKAAPMEYHATSPAFSTHDLIEGPELQTHSLKDSDSELITLPMDRKWPFLLRFPICCFGINLGLGSQTILWKILASQGYIWFMQVPILINLVLWCVATMALIIISTIYALKVFFYFEAVRREFNNPIRINFFFAPWAAYILLALGAPPSIVNYVHPNIWIIFMVPILALDIKVYGDWLSNGERHLCKVANPCTHLSLMGNFMGALLIATTAGYMELALFFWSIGFVHYLILLVTLYQRFPIAMVLSKELHPIFFLFVALPSSASVSWAKIMGEFDLIAKIIYFIAMFLFFCLVTRFKIFYGFRFNIAWWAYTFPLTVSAVATLQYSLVVKHPLTQTLAALLTIASSFVVVSLAITTLLHTFVWRSMFPNDMVITISRKGQKGKRKIKEIQEDILPS